MRHIARWTFNTAAAISLLLCVAIVALWIRSAPGEELFMYSWRITPLQTMRLGLDWHVGQARIFVDRAYWPDGDHPTGWKHDVSQYSARRFFWNMRFSAG